MTVNVVSFAFSWCSTGGPEAHSAGWWLSLLHLISNFPGPQLIRAPRPFGLMWLSLPHLVYNSVSNSNWNCLTSVLTELFNSSTPTQSPTRSLEWHGWSSSSGNNCHAVHRSLSSGASVYECTMGIFFTSSHFISQFPPTRFPLITAIWMCHFLPVHHLGIAFLAESKDKIQHLFRESPILAVRRKHEKKGRSCKGLWALQRSIPTLTQCLNQLLPLSSKTQISNFQIHSALYILWF